MGLTLIAMQICYILHNDCLIDFTLKCLCGWRIRLSIPQMGCSYSSQMLLQTLLHILSNERLNHSNSILFEERTEEEGERNQRCHHMLKRMQDLVSEQACHDGVTLTCSPSMLAKLVHLSYHLLPLYHSSMFLIELSVLSTPTFAVHFSTPFTIHPAL